MSPFGHTKSQAEITTYPKPGYQNAPKFCENMDKALATNAFYIPNLEPGKDQLKPYTSLTGRLHSSDYAVLTVESVSTLCLPTQYAMMTGRRIYSSLRS